MLEVVKAIVEELQSASVLTATITWRLPASECPKEANAAAVSAALFSEGVRICRGRGMTKAELLARIAEHWDATIREEPN